MLQLPAVAGRAPSLAPVPYPDAGFSLSAMSAYGWHFLIFIYILRVQSGFLNSPHQPVPDFLSHLFQGFVYQQFFRIFPFPVLQQRMMGLAQPNSKILLVNRMMPITFVSTARITCFFSKFAQSQCVTVLLHFCYTYSFECYVLLHRVVFCYVTGGGYRSPCNVTKHP